MVYHPRVTLYKNNRPSGSYWEVRWYTKDGKRKSKGLGPADSMTKREAENAARSFEAQLLGDPRHGCMLEAPALKAWTLAFMAARNDLGDRTLYEYEHSLGLLVSFFGEGRKIDTITRADAQLYRTHLAGREGRNQEKPSENTTRKHIRAASVLFTHAVDLDLCPFDPFDRQEMAPLKSAKQWAAITREDIAKAIEQAPDHETKAMLALSRYAGLRAGESLRLEFGHIDWANQRINVHPDGPYDTTKQRYRQVPMTPDLEAVLRAAMEAAQDGQRLVVPIGYTGILKRSMRALMAAGIGRYAKPFHTLRKCLQTEWSRRYGVPAVASWLGNSPDVALDAYTRVEERDFAAVLSDPDYCRKTVGKTSLQQAKGTVDPNETADTVQ